MQARLNGAPATLLEILNGSFEDADDFNWTLERLDITKSFGVKLEVPLLKERLNLSAGFDYQNNDGKADFTATAVSLEDITDYDDYVKKTAKLKAEFAVKENLSLIAGYTYEKYEYDDILVNDYENIVGGNAYFSGAYADLDYEANIGYLSLNYKF